MASSQKKSQTRHQSNWLLRCFGFPPKPPSDKKPSKSGGRRRLFKLCLSKVKIMSFRKRKVTLDTKAAIIKATQDILLEASKVQQLKLDYHASSKTQDKKQQPKGLIKESHHLDNKTREDKLDDATCHTQDCKSKAGSAPKAKPCCLVPKVTRDSLIGLSIMAVTLIIMSFWGRLYAILCMSAWLYCVPLLRPARNLRIASSTEDSRLDLDSKLYKKKVVLEGFLQRDHIIAKTGLS